MWPPGSESTVEPLVGEVERMRSGGGVGEGGSGGAGWSWIVSTEVEPGPFGLSGPAG